MGYGSTSHMTIAKERKVLKFNRRIAKHRRQNNDHENIQELHNRHKAHAGYKRHSRKRSHCEEYTLSFSPEYKPASPMIIELRPLSYSDEYKPEKVVFEEETNNENYSGYIDSLMLLKMQREEQRSRELIEQLGKITFEDEHLNSNKGLAVVEE